VLNTQLSRIFYVDLPDEIIAKSLSLLWSIAVGVFICFGTVYYGLKKYVIGIKSEKQLYE
ncbi:MAG: hypothetical protein K2J63_12295, partial [Muribaculaceae bacterium]|nr:hypothetical protein [Muribaculaceae bacterium]